MFAKLFGKTKVAQSQQDAISRGLNKYRSDIFPHGILALKSNLTIKKQQSKVRIELELPFPCLSEHSKIDNWLQQSVDFPIQLTISTSINPVFQHNINGVKNVIVVSSGKGGVGKSTTSVNLAYALQAEGAKVAILDADLHGPSIPKMLNVEDKHPKSPNGTLLEPVDANGIGVMSSALLGDDDGTRIWKGSVTSNAFEQMVRETLWGDTDYLIIDMPPGTGDVQLTLAQKIPAIISVIVTTPQDVALIDAQKGIQMFRRLNVPILGLVENMSYHVCPNCQCQAYIFGEQGGKRLADAHQLPVLGQIPLNLNIRQAADLGQSLFNNVNSPDSDMLVTSYRTLAKQIASTIYYQWDSRSADFR